MILFVNNPVAVVVLVWTAVGVFKAVRVFGLEGAAIIDVEHAVDIVVFIGTAILVLKAVFVFGILGATVVCVEYAVFVVVWIRAPVAVREPVFVLRGFWAAVLRVQQSISVAVIIASSAAAVGYGLSIYTETLGAVWVLLCTCAYTGKEVNHLGLVIGPLGLANLTVLLLPTLRDRPESMNVYPAIPIKKA